MHIASEDQRLLLYIDHVCVEQGIAIPWNDIALAFEPRSDGKPPLSGEAVKQHIAKLRTLREAENLDVPPKSSRGSRRAAANISRKRKISDEDDEYGLSVGTSATKRPRALAPLPKKVQAEREKAEKKEAGRKVVLKMPSTAEKKSEPIKIPGKEPEGGKAAGEAPAPVSEEWKDRFIPVGSPPRKPEWKWPDHLQESQSTGESAGAAQSGGDAIGELSFDDLFDFDYYGSQNS